MLRLNAAGVSATVRRSFGEDVEGACGQLRRRMLEEEKEAAAPADGGKGARRKFTTV